MSRMLSAGLTMIALAASAVGPDTAPAQGRLRSSPAITGLAVGAELLWGSAWSFDEEIPELGRSEPDIPASSGVGAHLSYALTPRLGMRGTWPVADGRRNVGPQVAPVYRTAKLDAAQLRLSAGICWHFRRRR